jgi:hypothetical protein
MIRVFAGAAGEDLGREAETKGIGSVRPKHLAKRGSRGRHGEIEHE